MLNNIELYNDDCLEIMQQLIDKGVKVDMIITDPPYLHEKGGRGKFLLGDSLDRNKFNMKMLSNFSENNIYTFLNMSVKLMNKPQYYIFCSEKQLVYYLKWCSDNKYKYNILTWNKPLSILNRERYSTNIEYIIRIYSSGCALNKINLEDNPDKAIYYSKYKNFNQLRGTNKKHPSQKPIEILLQFIELSSNEGDTVLDPFMGSGTTGVACKHLNRKFIGIELDNNYFNIAKERIENE